MTTAALYVRVSYADQVHGYSLDTQERACREYAERQGWQVARVYREEGESAKTADRPELQRMLVDVGARGAGIEYVVVYDLSRLARDTFDHLAIQRHLEAHGCRLRAATQNLEDSDEGRFVQTVLSATNQLENALRRRKTTAGMRAALEKGRWPWAAPLGYRNRRDDATRRKWIEPDPATAPLIRWAFEQAATGLRSKDEIRRDLAARGLDVPRESLYRLLRNPIYAGRVVSPEWGVDQPGEHEALVDWPTFRAAARFVRRRRSHVTGPTDLHPFRQLTRCAGCGRGLAGYVARGRGGSGKSWPFYRCQRCRVNVAGARLEGEFARLLDGLSVSPAALDALELVIADVVARRASEQQARAEAAARRLASERQRLARLVDAYVYREAVPEPEYRRMRAELDQRIATLEEESAIAMSPAVRFEPALRAARDLLQTPLLAWDRLTPNARAPWLRGVFPAGLQWGPEGTFRTPPKSLLYLPLRAESRQVVAVGTPAEAEFEPLAGWILALARLGEATGGGEVVEHP